MYYLSGGSRSESRTGVKFGLEISGGLTRCADVRTNVFSGSRILEAFSGLVIFFCAMAAAYGHFAS